MKKILSVILTAAMALSLAACGGEKNVSSETGGGVAADPAWRRTRW